MSRARRWLLAGLVILLLGSCAGPDVVVCSAFHPCAPQVQP